MDFLTTRLAAIEFDLRHMGRENQAKVIEETRRQLHAYEALLQHDIWDWWYGEKRGHATPEEFAVFLEAAKSSLQLTAAPSGAQFSGESAARSPKPGRS